MGFLGFVDDTLALPWRVKLFLPLVAASPILVAYTGRTEVLLPESQYMILRSACLSIWSAATSLFERMLLLISWTASEAAYPLSRALFLIETMMPRVPVFSLAEYGHASLASVGIYIVQILVRPLSSTFFQTQHEKHVKCMQIRITKKTVPWEEWGRHCLCLLLKSQERLCPIFGFQSEDCNVTTFIRRSLTSIGRVDIASVATHADGRWILVQLGALYYGYMTMLTIFCTNAINIYAGDFISRRLWVRISNR